ncbi:type II secretion system protein F, partial [Achromatium sp. WMS1]
MKLSVFKYEGVDKKGNKVSGEVRAPTLALAKYQINKQGTTNAKVKKQAAPLFGGSAKKITPKDIAVFSRQLATMMQAGVAIVQAFDIVGKGHNNPSMQDLILKIKTDVEGGASLSNALRKHPLQFDDLFCSLVDAGEAAGVLDDLLVKIATYKEKTEAIKAKVKSALTYPVSVLIVAIVVMSILMIFVIPTFQEIFKSMGAEL